MKKIMLLFMATLFCAATLSAQMIKEGNSAMTQGNNNAFSIELRQTVEKDVEKAWIKFIKEYKGKTKKDKKTKEVFSDNAEIKDLSGNTVDVYSTVRQSGENTILTVWFDLGGAYLNSSMHGGKATTAEAMLNKFAMSVSSASVKEDLKAQEKVLKDLNGDMKGLQKDKTNLENDITKFERKIAEAKEAIKKNEGDQKTKAEQISAQEKVVNDIKAVLKKLK